MNKMEVFTEREIDEEQIRLEMNRASKLAVWEKAKELVIDLHNKHQNPTKISKSINYSPARIHKMLLEIGVTPHFDDNLATQDEIDEQITMEEDMNTKEISTPRTLIEL